MKINRLPSVNGDKGKWGDVLNSYLRVSHSENGSINVWTTSTRPLNPDFHQTGVNTVLDVLERFNGTIWEPVINITSPLKTGSSLEIGDIQFSVGTVFSGLHFSDGSNNGSININLDTMEVAKLVKAPLVITNTTGTNPEFTVKLQKISKLAIVSDLITYTIPLNTIVNTTLSGIINSTSLVSEDKIVVKIEKLPTVLGGFAFTISNPLIIKN
jgi:hypothetical protein